MQACRKDTKGGKRAAILLDKTPHELSESKDWTPYTITITSKDDSHKVVSFRQACIEWFFIAAGQARGVAPRLSR